MRIWQCNDCGARITTTFNPPESCECFAKNFKLVDKKDKCEICGNEDQRTIMTHHIVPKSFQGDNSEDNLMFLCANCHKIIHSELKERVKEWTLEKAKYRENIPEPKISKVLKNKEIDPFIIDNIIVFLDHLQYLEEEFGKPVPKEEIINHFKRWGNWGDKKIDEEKVEEILRTLKARGSIYEPRLNHFEIIE